jgi:predicted nucleic acid-binding protein
MPQLLWDASALAKRYADEAGSDTVDVLFTATPPAPMLATFLGYAETAASLRRKLNRGVLDLAAFSAARSALRQEVLYGPDFELLTIYDADILGGIALTDQHNLNSTDAAILAACLRYARAQPPSAAACLLLAADQRLLRAADNEGLRALNPEDIPAVDVPALLVSL